MKGRKFFWGNILMMYIVSLALSIILLSLGVSRPIVWIVSFLFPFFFPLPLTEIINKEEK
jgi:hypothetical protein